MRHRSPKPAAKSKTLQFSLTPQGFLIKVSNNFEQIKAFERQIVSYFNQLRSMDPDYAYDIALKKIQVVVDAVALHQHKPISCKAGCSACCHQKVDVAPFEAEVLMQHIADNPFTIDAQRLAVQVEALQRDAYDQLSFADRQCVFLKADQTCAIYSVRPLMCRRHFVQSDPAICRTEDFSRIELDVNTDVDAYLSAYVTKNATTALPLLVTRQSQKSSR